MTITTSHQLRPEHLNHHNTLYAGQITDWLIEAAFIAAAKLWGSTDHMVMASADNIRLTRPMVLGDILSLEASVVHLGTTSIVLRVQGTELLSGAPACSGEFVFVTVDGNGRKCPHGLRLKG